MAKVLPFRAIRPSKEKAAEIAALPYDVYNRKEACEVVAKNPGSFLAIDRAETNFDDSVDTYAEEVYTKAHDLLWSWVEEGRFIQDEKPCYYLYEITMDGRTQRGIVGCAAVADYENEVIKKHENTRADKEADRIHHVDTCEAQTGPIFLAHKKDEVIASIIETTEGQAPEYDVTYEDGVNHKVYVISDEAAIKSIEEAFEKMNAIYIADGHHRAASAVRVGQRRREANASHTGDEEYNYFLSVLFADEELAIMDYNRVVKDLNGMSADEFLSVLKEKFDVIEESDSPIHPREKGQFATLLNDKWYLCSIKAADRSDDSVKGLDVSLLQDLFLSPVLAIGDPKTDKRIDFVGGIRGLGELEKRCHEDGAVAFAMYPTSIAELFAVADEGRLMPPKSTWFEPKLRSGFFIHSIKE